MGFLGRFAHSLKLGAVKLNEIGLWTFGEGSWQLRALEREIIDRAITTLDKNGCHKVEQQLLLSMFVERSNPRINTVHFKQRPLELTLTGECENALIRVALSVNENRQTVNVTVNRGFLFNIEFPEKAKFYRNQIVEIGPARVGKSRHSYTTKVDRAEHGKL